MSQPITAEGRQDLVAGAANSTPSNVESRQDLPQGAVNDEEVSRLERALHCLQSYWANQIFHPL
jgi:hypothetical protein